MVRNPAGMLLSFRKLWLCDLLAPKLFLSALVATAICPPFSLYSNKQLCYTLSCILWLEHVFISPQTILSLFLLYRISSVFQLSILKPAVPELFCWFICLPATRKLHWENLGLPSNSRLWNTKVMWYCWLKTMMWERLLEFSQDKSGQMTNHILSLCPTLLLASSMFALGLI